MIIESFLMKKRRVTLKHLYLYIVSIKKRNKEIMATFGTPHHHRIRI